MKDYEQRPDDRQHVLSRVIAIRQILGRSSREGPFLLGAGRLDVMQMSHSSVSVNDRAIHPVPGKGPEMVDNHIASHIKAGWKMAFYAAYATTTGTNHHFIWSGPETLGEQEQRTGHSSSSAVE